MRPAGHEHHPVPVLMEPPAGCTSDGTRTDHDVPHVPKYLREGTRHDDHPSTMTKIESIEVVPTTLPDMFGEQMHLCLVRVEAEGVVGWGEICDSYCCTFPEVYAPLVDHVYAPLVLGSELVSVDALTRKLRMWARRRIGDAGLAIQALSGLELALWDLHGKLAGQSVSQLIGQTRDRIPVYASGKFLDEPIDMHVRILAPAIDRGVNVAKVRTSLDPDADLAVLHELRAELPPSLSIHGRRERELLGHHRAPPRRGAGRRRASCSSRSPCRSSTGARWPTVVSRSPLPIAYGEHLFGAAEFGDALADGWPHIAQPDPSIAGGLSECLQVAAIAEGLRRAGDAPCGGRSAGDGRRPPPRRGPPERAAPGARVHSGADLGGARRTAAVHAPPSSTARWRCPPAPASASRSTRRRCEPIRTSPSRTTCRCRRRSIGDHVSTERAGPPGQKRWITLGYQEAWRRTTTRNMRAGSSPSTVQRWGIGPGCTTQSPGPSSTAGRPANSSRSVPVQQVQHHVARVLEPDVEVLVPRSLTYS